VFCGICLRRNITDGLKWVEFAAENRKSGEYINGLLEKCIRQVEKESEQAENQIKKEKSNNDRK
jgi:hypothetical protein